MRTIEKIIIQISSLTPEDIFDIRVNQEGTQIVGSSKNIQDFLQMFTRYIHNLCTRIKNEKIAAKKAKRKARDDRTPIDENDQDFLPTAEDVIEYFAEKELVDVPRAHLTLEVISKLEFLFEELQPLKGTTAPFLVHLKGAIHHTLNPNPSHDETCQQKTAIKQFQKSFCDQYDKNLATENNILLNKLTQASQKYLGYLIEAIYKEAKLPLPKDKIDPYELKDVFTQEPYLGLSQKNPSLQAAIQKYQIVIDMYSKLHPSEEDEVPVHKRVSNFRKEFENVENKKIIKKRRDSGSMTFLKIVASVFSVGIAAPFLFRPKGTEFNKQIKQGFLDYRKNKP